MARFKYFMCDELTARRYRALEEFHSRVLILWRAANPLAPAFLRLNVLGSLTGLEGYNYPFSAAPPGVVLH